MMIGQLVLGKYQIERVLGEGGMGRVLAAYHPELDRRVALKVLLPELMWNPELVARFLREAQATATLESRHVARVHDVGRLDDGAPFIVMELLEGRALSRELEAPGAAPGRGDRRVSLAGLRCARGGARARHRASGHQAGEPLSDEDA